MSRYGSNFGAKVQEKKDSLLDDKFAWFSGRPNPTQRPKPKVQQPIMLQSRSGKKFFGKLQNKLKKIEKMRKNKLYRSKN